MQEFLLEHYLWIKALHIIAVISWMAGMLYLPRLFVYHTDAADGSEMSRTFKLMERRLLKFIMTPAMILTWIFGLTMIAANPAIMDGGWIHVKLLLVLCLSGAHGFFAVCVKKFARNENARSAKFYRILNEAPTILMVVIVILAIVKPS